MTDHIPDAGKKVDHIIKAARQVWGESAILPFAELERFYAIAFKAGMEKAAEIAADVDEPGWTGYECPNTFDDGRRAAVAAIRAHAQNIDMTQPSCTKSEGN